MKTFIEQQKELGRKLCPNTHKEDHNQMTYVEMTEAEFDAVITQIITNTGEELMRRAEGVDEYVLKATVDDQIVYDSMSQSQKKCLHKNVKKGTNQAIDTIKQHITSVTGVEI